MANPNTSDLYIGNIISLDFNVKNSYNLNLNVNNKYSFDLDTYAFSVTDSLFLNSKSYLELISSLKMNKKISAETKDFIQALSLMKMNKKLLVKSNSELQTIFSMKMNKKLNIEVDLTITAGKLTTLGQLDDFTLGELDNVQYLSEIDGLTLGDIDSFTIGQLDAPNGNYTLGFLDNGFANGVNFIAAKKIVSNIDNQLETITNINKYRLGLLSDYDGLTLESIDSLTLKELDLILDN